MPNFQIGILALLLGICVGDQFANPKILTKPYVPPWATLPDTPHLPTAIESGHVNVDNETAIWYGFFGQELSRTLGCGQIPVLFLHGGFANSNYFGHQIWALLDLPFTLMAIDSRGQGRSTDGSGPITYDQMAGDVLAVLDHFHIQKVALVGWSDGSIIGFDIAMNHSSRLDRLFSFGGSYDYLNGNTTLDTNPIFNAYLQRTELEYKQLNPYPERWPELSDKMKKMWSTLPVWDQESFGRIPTLYADQLAPLVWILDGDSEEVVNRTVPAVLHDWIPGSGLVILPSVSHFAFLQDPRTFTALLLRFLDYDVGASLNLEQEITTSQRTDIYILFPRYFPPRLEKQMEQVADSIGLNIMISVPDGRLDLSRMRHGRKMRKTLKMEHKLGWPNWGLTLAAHNHGLVCDPYKDIISRCGRYIIIPGYK